jgi:deoxyribonuclease-4
MTEFEQEIGFDRLVAVHANDSKVELGSGRDRHENIGEGHIGIDGFRRILHHRAFADVPFLLEVPGFGADAKGPDKENVDILKRLRDE